MILFINIVAWGFIACFALAYCSLWAARKVDPVGYYDASPKAWLWPSMLLSTAWLVSRLFA